jgi:replicative DNA helicase
MIQNLEAERMVLGALLVDNTCRETVEQYIQREDFLDTKNREVFDAIKTVMDKGHVADLITVTDAVQERNKNTSATASYVASLTTIIPSSANVEYYAKAVREASLKRKFLVLSQDMGTKVQDRSVSSDMLVESTEVFIDDVISRVGTIRYVQPNEVMSDLLKLIERRYHNKGAIFGVPTGFPKLDDVLDGLQKADYIVIGARPSVGKTALIMSFIENQVLIHNLSVGLFSLEMAALLLLSRMISSIGFIDSRKIRNGAMSKFDFDNLNEAAAKLYDAKLFICDEPGIRFAELKSQARAMKRKHDIQVLYIDYLTLITPDNSEVPRYEQISHLSRSLKALSRELDIPVVVLSQLTRGAETRPPVLSDLRESGSIEQDADVVIFLHRDKEDKKAFGEQKDNVETDCIVAKQRNGPVGTVKLAFVPRYTRFREMDYGAKD